MHWVGAEYFFHLPITWVSRIISLTFRGVLESLLQGLSLGPYSIDLRYFLMCWKWFQTRRRQWRPRVFITIRQEFSPNYASSSTSLVVGAAVLLLLPLLVIHDAFLWQEVSHKEVQCRGGGAAEFWCGSSKRQYIDENSTEETLLLCKIFNNSIPKWNVFIFREFSTVDTS